MEHQKYSYKIIDMKDYGYERWKIRFSYSEDNVIDVDVIEYFESGSIEITKLNFKRLIESYGSRKEENSVYAFFRSAGLNWEQNLFENFPYEFRKCIATEFAENNKTRLLMIFEGGDLNGYTD